MEATVGGSGGIPLDSSLETGRGEEKNLEIWRLNFLILQETGTRVEQEQERSKNEKKRRLREHFSEKLEVSKKETVKGRIYN